MSAVPADEPKPPYIAEPLCPRDEICGYTADAYRERETADVIWRGVQNQWALRDRIADMVNTARLLAWHYRRQGLA